MIFHAPEPSKSISSPAYSGPDRRENGRLDILDKNRNTWRPLLLLNLYRLLISSSFFVLVIAENYHSVFQEVNTAPLIIISASYLLLCLAFFQSILRKIPAFHFQVLIHIVTDIAAICLFAHFSGGVGNHLAILLAISIAGGSMLTDVRMALFFAALASFSVLADSLIPYDLSHSSSVNFTKAGVLGITFFATALLASALAQRIRLSEKLAEERGAELLTMEKLTRYVVERLQTGVLLFDEHNQPQLLNDTTRHMLDLGKKTIITEHDLDPILVHELQLWQSDNDHKPSALNLKNGSLEVIPRFAKVGHDDENSGTLVFLEDQTSLAYQAQQLKLASLGRLTASIAHEIRNPLGAISHAGQLLAESDKVDENDKRLTEIISQQSKRLDKIVDNIMQLSQRKALNSEDIDLMPWLEQLKIEFCQQTQFNSDNMRIINEIESAVVKFDPSHLQQIVWNLCSNALRYGQSTQGDTQINLRVFDDGLDHLTVLEVSDQGQGIPKSLINQIFEPFFTTGASGTGLGLYIAKELCANNQAQLLYHHDQNEKNTGACFRIYFADSRRQIHAA